MLEGAVGGYPPSPHQSLSSARRLIIFSWAHDSPPPLTSHLLFFFIFFFFLKRCTAFSYVTYTIFCISVVYPLVACWAWNPNGWLSAKRDHEALLGCGVVDFAGSGVVHLLGGTAALVGASMVGPRQSFANGSLQTPMCKTV